MPVVQIDQPTGQREPDTQTALGAIGRLIALEEQIEDARQSVRGNPDAVVAHANLECPVARAGVDRDLAAGLGELGGVVQDVGHDLNETDPIAVDQEGAGGSGGKPCGDAVPSGVNDLATGVERVGDDVADVHRLAAQA